MRILNALIMVAALLSFAMTLPRYSQPGEVSGGLIGTALLLAPLLFAWVSLSPRSTVRTIRWASLANKIGLVYPAALLIFAMLYLAPGAVLSDSGLCALWALLLVLNIRALAKHKRLLAYGGVPVLTPVEGTSERTDMPPPSPVPHVANRSAPRRPTGWWRL